MMVVVITTTTTTMMMMIMMEMMMVVVVVVVVVTTTTMVVVVMTTMTVVVTVKMIKQWACCVQTGSELPKLPYQPTKQAFLFFFLCPKFEVLHQNFRNFTLDTLQSDCGRPPEVCLQHPVCCRDTW